jgi:glycosyltransferase involved in cell wall biosynthesis
MTRDDRGPGDGAVPPARHLVHVFPTFAVGGSQRRLSILAPRLGGDFRHTVLALDGVTEAAQLFDPNARLSVRPEILPKHRTLTNVLRARRIVAGLEADCLVTYNWGAIEFALAARTLPRLRHLHCEDGFGAEERDTLLRRRIALRRLALGGRARVVVPSRALARIATEVWRLPPARVAYVPNGIDVARFAVDPAARQAAGRAPHIGTIAALRPEKNLARLLAATARLHRVRPLHLTIVGDGPARAELEREAARLGLEPGRIFVGASSTPEQYLAEFDVFALSSDTEQMPLTVLEAMAAGLPIAAVDVGDITTMVAEANLPFVVARDVAPLADALGALLDDPARRHAVGAANRAKVVERFGLNDMIRSWRSLFA